MKHKLWLIAWFACATLLQFGASVPAAIPNADNPNAYTQRKYREDLVEFNRRTLVESYKKVGRHSQKWDKEAVDFLEGMALTLSNAGSDKFNFLPNVPSLSESEKQGRALLAANCDDPLILDMFTITLNDQNKIDEMIPLARKAADQMVKSDYPIYRVTNAVRRALKWVNPRTEANLRQRYDQFIQDGDLATLKSGIFLGIDRRIIFLTIEEDLEGWPVERQGQFCTAAKAAQADPWLVNMLGGNYRIKSAWAARGSGWANTVKPEGWAQMAAELVEARKCFVEAYRLQPKFPDAPAAMISVVMAEGERPGETLRTWFDRAVELQFDFRHAYDSYLYALLPRWRGSYSAMYNFGLECADTGRFDTYVPLYYLDALQDIRNDMEGTWDYWKRPGVFEKLSEVLSEYAEHARTEDGRPFFYSQIAGYAWQVGRYDLGRTALDHIKGGFDQVGVELAMTLPRRAVSGIYAMTGAAGERVKQAEANLIAGNTIEAIKAYRTLSAGIHEDDPAAYWIRGRTQELIWQAAFDTNDPVNLISSVDLAGWSTEAGKFVSDGKSITGITDATGAALICGCRFGPKWELRGTIEIMPARNGAGKKPDGGPIFCWTNSNHFCAIYFRPGDQQVGYRYDTGRPTGYPGGQIGQKNDFIIRAWDGGIELIVNGKQLAPYADYGARGRQTENRFGIGSYCDEPGCEFRVTDLQVRKLQSEPVKAN